MQENSTIFKTTSVGTEATNYTEDLNNTATENEIKSDEMQEEEIKVQKSIVCMAYSGTREKWDQDMCITEIKFEENTVECQCTSADNLF